MLRVRERKHPKLYLFDPGVVRALKGRLAGPPLVPLGGDVGPVLLGGPVHFFFTLRPSAATARHSVDRATVSFSRSRSSSRVASGAWRIASRRRSA